MSEAQSRSRLELARDGACRRYCARRIERLGRRESCTAALEQRPYDTCVSISTTV
jgi:hypothetical protein